MLGTFTVAFASFVLLATLGSAVASADDCSNAAVRAQQASAYLPECRAYEMVSNPGLGLGDASRVPAMSNDGTIVAYTAPLPDEISLGGGTVTIGVARRGPSGWSRESGDPFTYGSLTGNLGLTEPITFSPDFTKELVNTNLPADPDDADNNEDYYAVDVGQGASTLMTQGLASFPYKPLGATPDLGRVVYSVVADSSELGIFASDGTDKELISVDENGDPFFNPTPAGSAADRGLYVGVGPGSHRPFVAHGGVHAVSEDAQRVYFYGSAEDVGGLGVAGSLYLNDHGTSAPIAPVALFLAAAPDGSSAYFASLEELAPGAGPGGGIYRYDVASEETTLIVPATDPGGLNLSSAMASNDQTHLYFTSNNALTGGAVAGEWNAYVWTEAGLRFITKVDEPDKFERVGLDGDYALLLSSASIDGAPNNGHRAVYEYDYAADETLCVSCRPDGSLSQGGASIEDQPFNIPNSPSTQSRALTDDGRVVFNSRDRLTAEDESAGQDVYIYNQGRVGLLSSGEEATDSYVGDVSDDGRHVAIITRGALLAVDRDPHEYDIYDVASGGGFLEPSPPPAPCSGEECRGQGSSAPDQSAVPTTGLIPPEKARKCRRGKVRAHGRCVKRKHHRKKNKARRHSSKRDGSNKGGTGR